MVLRHHNICKKLNSNCISIPILTRRWSVTQKLNDIDRSILYTRLGVPRESALGSKAQGPGEYVFPTVVGLQPFFFFPPPKISTAASSLCLDGSVSRTAAAAACWHHLTPLTPCSHAANFQHLILQNWLTCVVFKIRVLSGVLSRGLSDVLLIWICTMWRNTFKQWTQSNNTTPNRIFGC